MTELRAGRPVVTSGVTIVPVESVGCGHGLGPGGLWVSGFKQPVAVVLLRNSQTYAFDISGAEVDAMQLARDVPELQQVLDGLAGAE